MKRKTGDLLSLSNRYWIVCVSACMFKFVLVVALLTGNQGTSEFRYVARQFFAFLCFPLFLVTVKTGLLKVAVCQVCVCVPLFQ